MCTNTSTVQIRVCTYYTYTDMDMHRGANIDMGYGIYPISIATPTPSQNYKRARRDEGGEENNLIDFLKLNHLKNALRGGV